jgi:hypothetical protein
MGAFLAVVEFLAFRLACDRGDIPGDTLLFCQFFGGLFTHLGLWNELCHVVSHFLSAGIITDQFKKHKEELE